MPPTQASPPPGGPLADDVDVIAALERLGTIARAPDGTYTPHELAKASREAVQLRTMLKKRKEQVSRGVAGMTAAVEAQAAQLAGELQALLNPGAEGIAPDGAGPQAIQGVAALQQMAARLRTDGDTKQLPMIEKLLEQLQKLTEQEGDVLGGEMGQDGEFEVEVAMDSMELDSEDKPLKKGDGVEGNWMRSGKWYPGKIHKVNADKTYLVHFDDGDIEDNMEEVRVRRAVEGSTQEMVMMVMGANGEWQTVQDVAGQGSEQMAGLLAQLQGAQAGQRARPHASSAPAPGEMDTEEFESSPKQSVVSWNTQHWKNF